MKLKDYLKIVSATTILCVVVFIRIPIGSIPFTLQTLMVILIGLLFKPHEAFISVVLYLLIGLIGIPVFAGGASISAFVSPTGGFLLTFPIVSFLISLLKSKNKSIIYDLFIITLLVIPLTYSIAAGWFSYQTKTPYFNTFIIFGWYMLGDLFKIMIAYAIYYRLPATLLETNHTL